MQNLRWLAERQNVDGGWAEAEGGRRRKPLSVLIRKLTGATSAAIMSLGIFGDDLAGAVSVLG